MQLRNIQGCKANLPMFNLGVLLMLNLGALVYVCLYLPYASIRFCRSASSQAASHNRKI